MKTLKCFTIFILTTLILVAKQTSGNTTTQEHCKSNINSSLNHYSFEHSLVNCLFKDDIYESFVRPASSVDYTVKVNFDLKHSRIIKLDAKEGTLNIQFWTFESWIDDRLTWDPVDFGGLRVITVPKDLVWSPNIQMYNRHQSHMSSDALHTQQVKIHADGNVTCHMIQQAHVPCDMVMTHFPKDTQFCYLMFASWAYNKSQMEIIGKTKNPTHTYDSGNFKIVSFLRKHQTYAEEGGSTSHLIYCIILERQASFIYTTVIYPTALITILMISIFFVKLEHRLNIAVGLLIICTLILTQVDSFLSINSSNTPMIVSFVTFIMTMITIIILMNLLVLHLLVCSDHIRPVPQLIKTLLFGRVCKVLYIKSNHYNKNPIMTGQSATWSRIDNEISQINTTTNICENTDETDSQDIKVLKEIRNILRDQSKNKDNCHLESFQDMNSSDWLILSKIIDKICFLFCVIITICVTISVIHK